MRIVVCIKPVPDSTQWSKISLDPVTKVVRREGIPSIINPLDKHALTEGVRLAQESGGEVIAISMAPPWAEESLREALALGAHRGVLLSDRAFAGADSLATARVLAAGIRRLGTFQLVLCGTHSLDGSTAQVGPELGELLGVPHVSQVSSVELRGQSLRVRCQSENGCCLLQVPLPALVTVTREVNNPRGVTLMGLVAARSRPIETWGLADLDQAGDQVGLAGSPTKIADVFVERSERRRQILSGGPGEAAAALIDRLRTDGVLPTGRGER